MDPDETTAGSSEAVRGSFADLRLTATQKEILEALCGPRASGNRYATPATNQEIASKVYLSVDAVKAHLRVLYRKFGVEPLPHNQKRARLVELVFEGGVLDLPTEEEEAAEPGAPPLPAPSRGEDPLGSGEPRGSRRVPLIAAGALAAAAVLAIGLAAAGPFDGSDSSAPDEESTPLAEFRADVNRFCGLAVPFDPPAPAAPVADRADAYYSALLKVADRVDSIPPPPGRSPSLGQFTSGLQAAADINAEITLGPPSGRSRERAVANLTIASGKVQAGSIGFGLGGDCKAIAGVILQSAESLARAG